MTLKGRVLSALIGVSGFVTLGCTPIQIYESEAGIQTATMAFSTTQTDVRDGIGPHVYFQSSNKNCEMLQIPSQAVEVRPPNMKPKRILNLDSGEAVQLTVVFEDVPFVEEVNVTYLESNTLNYRPKQEINFDNCEQTISFLPQQDKHYEIYFGMSRGACFLRVVNTVYNDVKKEREFLRVDLLDNAEVCSH